jgi:nucleoside-diphosphate-sugar epimerase
MKVLFIGGTGNISSACSAEATRQGHELFHFNRGRSELINSKGILTLLGDINTAADRKTIEKHAPFDVVANFICFTPGQMQNDIEFFTGKTKQYIFISSATVYKKPPDHYIITEECPLSNPFWKYSQDKIACENILTSQNKLPYTIVRPSYTYGRSWIPVAFTANTYNPVHRIRKGLPIISHGDGESLWVMTHNTDFAKAFVGLFGKEKAMNNHFHITSDEVHTWDQIYRIIGKIVGKEPKLIHIPSDFINKLESEWGAALLGDKACSMVFDNTKIKSVVPGWKAQVTFEQGIRESIAWFEEKPERMKIDREAEKKTDMIIRKFPQ